jgi:hypothetical protein
MNRPSTTGRSRDESSREEAAGGDFIARLGLDAPDELPDLDEQDLEAFDPDWNLQERHAAIMRSLAKLGVSVSGQNRFKRPALSIEDVDLILERLMGRYGVVSDYEVVVDDRFPRVVELKTREEEGVYERWEVAVTSIVRDTRPENRREVELRTLWDVGSNPSAAISFALKRHKRELYHLGAVKEGVSDEGRGGTGYRAPARRELERTACPLCGFVGALGWSSKKNAYFCAQAKGGCGEEMGDLTERREAGVREDRQKEVDRLLRMATSVGLASDGQQRMRGAPQWSLPKLRARIKLHADTRATFEAMDDQEWARGTTLVEGELVKEHTQWCGSGCAHLTASVDG